MFQKFLNSLKTPYNQSLIETIQIGYNTIFEERRHVSQVFELKNPIKDDDVITVYHGFNNSDDAITIAKFGLSGKIKADRLYSFETGNNPNGLFVTTSLKFSKEYSKSGVIIEFAAKVKDLDTPVWVNGNMEGGFKDVNERKNYQLKRNDEMKKSDVKSISDSDRPELADSLFMGNRALYVGDLNPNMIRAFWVNERLMNDRRTDGNWERITRKEFIKKYVTKENTDNANKYNNSYKEAKRKIFSPNDEYDDNKFTKGINKSPEKLKEIIDKATHAGNLISLIDSIKLYLWPKQIEQFKEKYNLIKNNT